MAPVRKAKILLQIQIHAQLDPHVVLSKLHSASQGCCGTKMSLCVLWRWIFSMVADRIDYLSGCFGFKLLGSHKHCCVSLFYWLQFTNVIERRGQSLVPRRRRGSIFLSFLPHSLCPSGKATAGEVGESTATDSFCTYPVCRAGYGQGIPLHVWTMCHPREQKSKLTEASPSMETNPSPSQWPSKVIGRVILERQIREHKISCVLQLYKHAELKIFLSRVNRVVVVVVVVDRLIDGRTADRQTDR